MAERWKVARVLAAASVLVALPIAVSSMPQAAATASAWQTPTTLGASAIRPWVGVDGDGEVQATWVHYVAGDSRPASPGRLSLFRGQPEDLQQAQRTDAYK